ncbi:CBS domain-containing protein [Legionella fallonii]|nr:CBS domain-containing protein [Legionella fallonii]
MANLIHNVLPRPARKIFFIKPEDTVKQCIELMAEYNIGALVVRDENDKLIGIVSERDIVFSCLHQGMDINTTKVSEVVSSKVTVLSPHDTVEMAMQAMTDTRRRHILIYEGDELVSILSIGDVLFHILETKAREIEHLENYIAR